MNSSFKLSDNPEKEDSRALLKTLLSGLLMVNACTDEGRSVSGGDNRACLQLCDSIDADKLNNGYDVCMKKCREQISDGILKVKKEEEKNYEKNQELPKTPEKKETLKPEIITKSGIFIVSEDIQDELKEFIQMREWEGEHDLPRSGRLFADQMEGNGNRDVLLYIPSEADPSKPYRLIYHFHGTYGQELAKRKEGMKKKEWVGWDRLRQTMEAVQQLHNPNSDFNAVLVYPFSAGKRMEPGTEGWTNKWYDRMWMRNEEGNQKYNDSFDKLYAESKRLAELKLMVPKDGWDDYTIAEAHSSGGIALKNIALMGTRHIDEYIFQDSSYAGWAMSTHTGIMESGSNAKMSIITAETWKRYGPDRWCNDYREDAENWYEYREWCEDDHMEDKPEELSSNDPSCIELKKHSEEWETDFQDWCEFKKTNPSIFLHSVPRRKNVLHSEFPRQFSGGLNLPKNRFQD